MKYVAEDGKVFDTEKACAEYEVGLKKETDEQEAAKAEVQRLRKEFYDAGERYTAALEAYNDRYHPTGLDALDILAWLLS